MRIFLFIVLTIFTSQWAFAAKKLKNSESNLKNNVNRSITEDLQKPNREVRGESALKRDRSKFTVEGKSLASSNFFLKAGLGVGYSFNADVEASLIGLAGGADLKGGVSSSESISIDLLTASSLLVAGNARYFFGNSFSVQGGIGYRRVRFNANVSAKQSNEEVVFDVTAENLILYSAIGNQWSFDSGFNLGCDWLAISIPVTKAWKSTMTTTGLSDSEMSSLQNTVSDLGGSVSKIYGVTLGILSFGYRF